MTPLQKAAKNLLEIFYTTGKPIDVYVYDLRNALEAEQAQAVDMLLCDKCGAITPDPWHYSAGGSKHLHACDACHQQAMVPEGNWLWCKLMDFCKKRRYAPADFDDLFAIVGEARAKQSEAPTWEAERIDEYEIRVTSPEGESWRLRSADRNDSFNNFIWRWAESIVNKGTV